MQKEIVENVLAFIDRAATLNAHIAEQRFAQDFYLDCVDGLMQSPIEQLFWVALKSQCNAESMGFNPAPVMGANGLLLLADGIHVSQQQRIGNYKVDFVISQVGLGPVEFLGPVIVELDGHAFHDKDKRQRAYEKERDRFLTRAHYKVLHFTGSEVVADPFKVAFEVLDTLGAFHPSLNERTYDPANPLGLE